MKSPSQAAFGYQIRPAGEGWSWVSYDLDGIVQEQGWAPQKALAAACVVRALARMAIAGEVRAAAAPRKAA
jgi:hypothetical protein